MSDTKYHNLRHLGAYLHQDWEYEYTSPNDAIEAFIKDDSSPEFINNFCAELQEIIPLVQEMADPERFLCEVLGWNYCPTADGLTVADWLRRVQELLRGK